MNCSCPDFIYRFGFQATQNKYDTYSFDKKKIRNPKLGVVDPQSIPANITNPKDSLGSSCKHTLLVLSNNSWLMKVASVINNYVKYMEKNYQKAYADIIYPAIYEKPYEDRDREDTRPATGHAYEKEGSSFINKTSYIENCETSAVGRALAMLGFEIKKSIASREEVENAKLQQQSTQPKISKEQATTLLNLLKAKFTDEQISKTLNDGYGVKNVEELNAKQYVDILNKIKNAN